MRSPILKTVAQYQAYIRSEITVCRDLLQKIKEKRKEGLEKNDTKNCFARAHC
jgi:hypothetical protein